MKNHSLPLTDIILDENNIKENIKEQVASYLQTNQDDITSEFTPTSTVVTDDTGTTQDTSSDSESVTNTATQSQPETAESSRDLPSDSSTQQSSSATLQRSAQDDVTEADDDTHADDVTETVVQSLDSASTWSSLSDFDRHVSRPRRPGNGYFSQALRSTGSAASRDSPLHTISAAQYAYSDVSAS